MTSTVLLDDNWDWAVDANGDLAWADDQLGIAQDVASAVKTFIGECWYDTTLGLPYFQSIFGQLPATSFIVNQIKQAALTITGVTAASVVELKLVNRQLTGRILVTTTASSTPVEVTF